MTAETWKRVESVVDALLDDGDRPSQQRIDAALERESPAVRREVRALLEYLPRDEDPCISALAQDTPRLLDSLALEAPDDRTAQPASWASGARVGTYRLIEEIGRGGMGTVFLAERADDQFEKQVAVKLLSHFAASGETRRRFLRERQILAGLEHPSIARLLDGGVAEDGSPFLVMEHVEGASIDDHCEANRLSLDRRLELFLEVCDAVSAAHAQLVVHRDIKPANVLVTTGGQVKLLDFGIAGLADEAGAEPATVVRAFTPEYASPEQLRLQRAGTASDIYSLGVLLYRLVAGRLPFELTGLSPADAERIVCQQDPPAPSVALRHDLPAPDGAGMLRALRRDLDHVVLRALAKEPERRYSSVAHLAADVRRHLAGLPVDARPATARYRLSRFVARNRLGVAAGSAVALSLVLGLAAALVQGERAARERDLARSEQAKAQTVSDFLIEIFEDASPFESAPPDARDLLARGEARVGSTLRDHPEARADLLAAMSRAHVGLGDGAAALRLSQEALDLELVGGADPDLARAMLDHAKALKASGDEGAGLGQSREALAVLEAAGADQGPLGVEAHRLLGLYQIERDLDAAERHLREALGLQRALQPGVSVTKALLLHDLAVVYAKQGRTDEEMRLRLEALEMIEPLKEPGAPVVFQMQSNLAIGLSAAGRFGEAEPYFLGSIEGLEARFGKSHPALIAARTSYGKLLLDEGRLADAEPHIERAYAIARPFEEQRFDAVAAKINLATLRRERGRLGESLALYRSSLVLFRQHGIDPRGPAFARLESLVGQTLVRMQRWDEAEPLLERAWRVQQQTPGAASDHRAETEMLLGALRCHRDEDPQRGTELLSQACTRLEERLGGQHWRLAACQLERAACGLRRRLRDTAHKDVEAAEALLNDTLPPGSYWIVRAREIRAELEVQAGAAPVTSP